MLQRMLDFMQDDADEIVIDTTALHKGTDVSVTFCMPENFRLYF